jgi:MFS family permease
VTGGYTVIFGGLMLLFGGIAGRFGRRRVMFAGRTLLTLASLGTLLVRTPGELVAVRMLMGTAAAMTTPVRWPCRSGSSTTMRSACGPAG